MQLVMTGLGSVGAAFLKYEWWVPLSISALIIVAAARWIRRTPRSAYRIVPLTFAIVVGIWFTVHSTLWSNAERVWTSVIVVAVVAVLTFARRLQDLSPATRTFLAAAGFVFLAVGILVGDVPGREGWRTFMADRALLSGFISSALLIGLGYLAVDAQVEGQRARRAARLRSHAFDQVSDYWRRTVGLNDLTVSDPESGCRKVAAGAGRAFTRSTAELQLINAIEKCAGEVAVWIAILGNLDDDDPENIVQLWADFRRTLLNVIRAYEEADYGIRPRTNEMVQAGLTLEEIRYRTAREERRTRARTSTKPRRRSGQDNSEVDTGNDSAPYFFTSLLLPIPDARVPGTITAETMFPWFAYDSHTPDGAYSWAKDLGTFAEGAGWWRLADKHMFGHRPPSEECVLLEENRRCLPAAVNKEIPASAVLRSLRAEAADVWKAADEEVQRSRTRARDAYRERPTTDTSSASEVRTP